MSEIELLRQELEELRARIEQLEQPARIVAMCSAAEAAQATLELQVTGSVR